MDCPNCFRENPREAKFCNYCGTQVAIACPSCQT
ncbi:MAG: zinc ribbon domain-containing protein [SAR202 cluster bacterium]|nr:zinc ribbon domain-containing protein [SAR202 cluster bacterium]MDP6300529.1 zinc ribbon domain-containing protein [SAR202 cluster bacterium]MDP7102855.1 zinc ribbon domain-containing protein [SAR202 cluster bacterium]MDP7224335.1 zinc ribbon domain-containing protein [SAR202 cluster bacterium]MDP7413342.1 zinc ribbon domain-containing protein [SAR202 cluster bacterium]